MRIAVIGDSLSSRNNGASAVAWPDLLDSMIKSLGVFDIGVRNYSMPGLRWRTAWEPTPGYLIGCTLSPVQAVRRDGADLVVTLLGANDRQNSSAGQDAVDYYTGIAPMPALFIRERFYDDTHGAMVTSPTLVMPAEAQYMEAVYDFLQSAGANAWRAVTLWKLYRMGMSYDLWHPTNSGKQWLAAAIYMHLQQSLPITPIGRNISTLFDLGFVSNGEQWVERSPRPDYDQLMRVPA